jgi:predicted Zn-dependent peptidase
MRFVKIIKFGLLLLLLIGNVCLASSSPVDIKLDVEEFELENGMLFLIVERPATPQVAARLAIRAGSALEATGI